MNGRAAQRMHEAGRYHGQPYCTSILIVGTTDRRFKTDQQMRSATCRPSQLRLGSPLCGARHFGVLDYVGRLDGHMDGVTARGGFQPFSSVPRSVLKTKG